MVFWFLIPLIGAVAGIAGAVGGAITGAVGHAKRAEMRQKALVQERQQRLSSQEQQRLREANLYADKMNSNIAAVAASGLVGMESAMLTDSLKYTQAMRASELATQRDQLMMDYQQQNIDLERDLGIASSVISGISNIGTTMTNITKSDSKGSKDTNQN